jgi:WD40 repeat protein
MDKDNLNKNKSSAELEAILNTTLPKEYQLKQNRVPLPSTYNKEKLNKLLRKLLKNVKIPDDKTFSFFISGKFLPNEKTINEFLQDEPELKQSGEETLEILYAFELPEPKLLKSINEDEWIRKINILQTSNYHYEKSTYYTVGLFNSEISIYNNSNNKVISIDQKNDSMDLLHDILFFKKEKDHFLIKCSRNEDDNLKIYSLDMEKASSNLIYRNIKDKDEYINCLSLNPLDFEYFCTGDTNGSIQIFKIPSLNLNEENLTSQNKINKNKKRKITAADILPDENATIEKCHGNNEIRLIKWINNQQILTSGDDFNIKLWNIHTKANYETLSTSHKLVTCFESININGNINILSSFDDGSIRLFDLKAPQNQNKMSFIKKGHTKFVSALSVDHVSNLNFSSVAYDGRLLVWDIRSNTCPLFDIKTESDKNYDVKYNSPDFLLTGGDNSSVLIYENHN